MTYGSNLNDEIVAAVSELFDCLDYVGLGVVDVSNSYFENSENSMWYKLFPNSTMRRKLKIYESNLIEFCRNEFLAKAKVRHVTSPNNFKASHRIPTKNKSKPISTKYSEENTRKDRVRSIQHDEQDLVSGSHVLSNRKPITALEAFFLESKDDTKPKNSTNDVSQGGHINQCIDRDKEEWDELRYTIKSMAAEALHIPVPILVKMSSSMLVGQLSHEFISISSNSNLVSYEYPLSSSLSLKEFLLISRNAFVNIVSDQLRRRRTEPEIMSYWENRIYNYRGIFAKNKNFKINQNREKDMTEDIKQPLKEVTKRFALEKFEGYQRRYKEQIQERLRLKTLQDRLMESGSGTTLLKDNRRMKTLLPFDKKKQTNEEASTPDVDSLLSKICSMLHFTKDESSNEDDPDRGDENSPRSPWEDLLSINGIEALISHSGAPLRRFLMGEGSSSNFPDDENLEFEDPKKKQKGSENAELSTEFSAKFSEKSSNGSNMNLTKLCRAIKWDHHNWRKEGRGPRHRLPHRDLSSWISKTNLLDMEKRCDESRRLNSSDWTDNLRGGYRSNLFDFGNQNINSKDFMIQIAEKNAKTCRRPEEFVVMETDLLTSDSIAGRASRYYKHHRYDNNIRLDTRGLKVEYVPYSLLDLEAHKKEALALAELDLNGGSEGANDGVSSNLSKDLIISLCNTLEHLIKKGQIRRRVERKILSEIEAIETELKKPIDLVQMFANTNSDNEDENNAEQLSANTKSKKKYE